MVYGSHILTCRFCGSQTIGTDFIDLNYVCQQCVLDKIEERIKKRNCNIETKKKKPKRMIQTG